MSVEGKRATKRLAFWLGVAAVSIVANIGWELAADKVPSLGFKQLVAYTHKGRG